MKDKEEVGDLAADQDEQAEVGERGLHLHHLPHRHHHLQTKERLLSQLHFSIHLICLRLSVLKHPGDEGRVENQVIGGHP